MFRFGKASWRKGCCDSCSMYIYEGNGPVASVPSQMRRCNTRSVNGKVGQRQVPTPEDSTLLICSVSKRAMRQSRTASL